MDEDKIGSKSDDSKEDAKKHKGNTFNGEDEFSNNDRAKIFIIAGKLLAKLE